MGLGTGTQNTGDERQVNGALLERGDQGLDCRKSTRAFLVD